MLMHPTFFHWFCITQSHSTHSPRMLSLKLQTNILTTCPLDPSCFPLAPVLLGVRTYQPNSSPWYYSYLPVDADLCPSIFSCMVIKYCSFTGFYSFPCPLPTTHVSHECPYLFNMVLDIMSWTLSTEAYINRSKFFLIWISWGQEPHLTYLLYL